MRKKEEEMKYFRKLLFIKANIFTFLRAKGYILVKYHFKKSYLIYFKFMYASICTYTHPLLFIL